MIRDLILKNRSYRRYYQDVEIETESLRELVDLARHSASGGNFQPLKYMLSNDSVRNAKIFEHLVWAGYLKDWPGPTEGERPSAYIVVMLDKRIAETPGCDQGIACQSILLGATEKGLGGCIIASIKKEGLRKALAIPENLELVVVVALGKPKEKVVIEEVGADGSVKYWRDGEEVHHVPKRKLKDIIVS